MTPAWWGWNLPSQMGGVRRKRRGTGTAREGAEVQSRWDSAVGSRAGGELVAGAEDRGVQTCR